MVLSSLALAASSTLKIVISGQNSNYLHYWANLGNANWTQNGASDLPASSAQYLVKAKARHNGKSNAQFTDGHAKSVDTAQLIGNVCYWTTDIEGTHPNCN